MNDASDRDWLNPATLAGVGGIYVTGEDSLRITTFNAAPGVALAIAGRFLDQRSGLTVFTERHVPNTDRTTASSVFRIGEGFLLNAMVFATAGSPRRGQCFALLEIVRGRGPAVVPIATLSQGYVTDSSRRAWPESPNIDSIEGPGVMRSITGTDPAAGVEWSETVPTNARWRLHGVTASIVTDATVASRVPRLTIDDGTTIVAQLDAGVLTPASSNHRHSWTRGAGAALNLSTGAITSIGPDVDLMGGFRVRTSTLNFQAGDNWGAPQLLVEEWIED